MTGTDSEKQILDSGNHCHIFPVTQLRHVSHIRVGMFDVINADLWICQHMYDYVLHAVSSTGIKVAAYAPKDKNKGGRE
jgi:hypothetical protein